ncbi:MAG: TolC family protein [Myxococcales bacterium FL481]|nr:MAG: TolC family protein [Myxococcales bacterium FL481]
MRVLVGAIALGLGLWSGTGLAAQPATVPSTGSPLTLNDVLVAAGATHPQLEAAERDIEAARGDRLAARGAWDPVVSVGGRWGLRGYYENGQLDTVVRQATPLWGVGAYAGYRVGWGSFPVYKGQLQTLSGGELRAGIDVPLWKDGPIDARRAKVQQTRAKVSSAECKRQATRLKLGQQAAKAYWRWVATGQEVRIQEALLEVAKERQEGLREQAALGSLPEIFVVDNRRLVLDREAKLVSAQQDFREATLALSLFLRDPGKNPVRAADHEVPLAIPGGYADAPDIEADIGFALRERPELCSLLMDRQAARVEVRLQRNQRAPAINGQAFVARDLGDGPAELAPTEFAAGFSVKMPLALRQARGNYLAAQAGARRLDAQLRGLRDRIGVEVRQAWVDLDTAQRQVAVTTQQVAVAQTLADAEREKFRQGASDLVIVNLREIAAANAARLEVEARAAYQTARADYLTATGRGL